MLLQLPGVLEPDEAAACRAALQAAEWVDGRATAGYQAAQVKDNMQVSDRDETGRRWGERIVAALEQTPLFLSAALPHRVFPPMFNRYSGGQTFGTHVDTAIRKVPGMPVRVRTDLSATLFLTPPEEYEGGELVIEDTYGVHAAKLPAGHMVLYPATSLHHVRPVTRGVRVAAAMWVQSMVAGDAERTLLYDLDNAIRLLARDVPGTAALTGLTGVYHNLVRRWSVL